MNILFLMGVYPSYGGVEKVSTVLANEFVSRGYQVHIVSFDQPYPEIAKEELHHSVRLYKLTYPVRREQNIIDLHHIIVQNKIDILINQWCVPFYVARMCKKAMKGTTCKLISVHHNIPDTNARIKEIEMALDKNQGNKVVNKLKLFAVRSFSRLSLRYTYNKSDLYTVLSPSFIPLVEQYIHIKRTRKLIALPNPVTIIREGLEDTQAKKKEILYVGRLENNQKRVFRLVDVWKELEHNHSDWSLIIVGDGPDRAELEQLIKRNNLKKISLEGFKDPRAYYERASVLLLLSEYEGFPLVLVEAMAFHVVPFVYGSFSAVHDVIEHGKTGYITNTPYSNAEHVKYLELLMSDDLLREQMAVRVEKASWRFELSVIADQWEEIFKAI